MLFAKNTLFLLCVFSLVLLTGCQSPTTEEVPMPPTPPEDRLQSVIFPNGRPPLDEAEEAAAPAIPEGITLRLKGKVVDFPLLETVADPGNRTVIVYANPTIPYSEVVAVLDRLHDMGFLISFKAED